MCVYLLKFCLLRIEASAELSVILNLTELAGLNWNTGLTFRVVVQSSSVRGKISY